MANTIIKPAIGQKFAEFLDKGRIFFFSAPCGFGKTSVAEALLERSQRKVVRLAAGTADYQLPKPRADWDVLLIDDLQQLQDENEWQALCQLIRSSSEKRFVLLSRGVAPGALLAFQYAGLMTVVNADEMLLDRDDVKEMFAQNGTTVTDSELTGICKESIGYPLGVAITVRLMAGGMAFGPEEVTQAYREVFLYFESAIYRRFDLTIRHFLLELAPFERFNLDMARMVSGDARAGELLDWLQRHTTMLRYDGIQEFHFWPQFQAFLLWEMERTYSQEKQQALFCRGGLYYELKGDYTHALECYTKGGDHSKVSDLLVRSSELRPGMSSYSELEQYYRSLPEAEILESPALMQGMSMLCALALDYEGSERWYWELADFARCCDKQDAAGKQARSRLAWLDISLPQRGVEGLTETIPAVYRLIQNKEIQLPPISVTATLPSVMNGAKDFSQWSLRDDQLYKSLKVPVEGILGADGVGLADCALAESKFEKGEDISARMLALISQLSQVQNDGTPDTELATVGLLARSQLATGQRQDARRSVESLRKRFQDRGLTQFLPNLDAMLCRIDLHLGNLDSADNWYREKAPRDPLHPNVLLRYQYLTQAMVELANGKPDAALMTLSPLEPYSECCRRYIGGIHLDVVSAIALYRKKDSEWKVRLTQALKTAEEFQFVRTVSVYGGAVLPLLTELQWSGEKKWQKRLMGAVRMQAAYYPDFLEPRLAPNNSLTAMELQILHLICADRSNAEIAEMMDVKLATVKTHVSHIFEKLDVSRRSEAKTAAKKLWLI